MSASIIGRAKDDYNLYYNAWCFPCCFDAVGSATGNASDTKNISLMQRSLSFVLLKVKKVLLIEHHQFSQLRSVTCRIWDHTVLPVTRHKWTHPTLTPARQAGARFTYHWGMEGWVDQFALLSLTHIIIIIIIIITIHNIINNENKYYLVDFFS